MENTGPEPLRPGRKKLYQFREEIRVETEAETQAVRNEMRMQSTGTGKAGRKELRNRLVARRENNRELHEYIH